MHSCVCVYVYMSTIFVFSKSSWNADQAKFFSYSILKEHMSFFFSRISSFFTDLIESLNGQLSQRDGMHLYQRTFVGLV